MQIDIGSVGLNLQATSVIILMEPQLKPSTEQQAIGRAHRMGQTRPVLVYRLARPSVLADAASELPVGVSDVNEGDLLAWARSRYGL
jgi:superfamily II DNA or RNA helicase